jgi:hypothetical protein
MGTAVAMTQPGSEHADRRALADVARDCKRGAATAHELFDAFLSATLYWPAPKARGIPVIRLGESLVAPLFSTEEELIKVSGRGAWLAATGLEVLSIIPPGVTIGLDIGSDHRLQLDPAAARLEYELVMRRRETAPSDAGATDPEKEV